MYSTMNPWAQQPPPPGTQQYGYPQAPPAYHPVQVRQSFNTQPLHFVPIVQQPLPPPPPPTMAPVEAVQRKKIDWPQPVRNYVARSFDPKALLDDVSRPDMEAKLKQTITNATDNNTLGTLDWDNMPLPQQMIRQERAQAWQQESVDLRVGGMVPNSKKRKSQDNISNDEDSSATPPWRANTGRIEDRITYGHQQSFKETSPKNTSKSQKEKRQKRFDSTTYKIYKRSPSPEPTTGPVVGTCEVLEKRYFRLTSAPIPSQVRPEPVLRKTLELLKKKWRAESNYGYICDQFKSMRQDLTVQRIRNEFTVTVYEIHARIALEKADLGEYNQCQTQLRALYAQSLGGNPVEFKAYRILYFIHTSNRTALNDVLADLTTAEKEEQAIKHALGVRSALALGNYHRFFRLYLETPNMGAYLMDMFVVRERLAALANICKAYKPDVKIRFITEELGFESDHQTCQFIVDYSGQHLIEEKEDDIRFLCAKGAQLFEAARKDAFRTVDIKGQI